MVGLHIVRSPLASQRVIINVVDVIDSVDHCRRSDLTTATASCMTGLLKSYIATLQHACHDSAASQGLGLRPHDRTAPAALVAAVEALA